MLTSGRKFSGGCLKIYAPVSCPQLRLFLEYTYTELIKPQYLKVNLASCLILRALLREQYQWLS